MTGLYGKFHVSRMDGRDLPGGDKSDARYFVLDYVHDRFSRAALNAYAYMCEASQPELARDLYELIRRYNQQPLDSESNGGTNARSRDDDRLATIVRLQREFQEGVLGYGDLTQLPPDDRAAYFRTQSLALVFELGEASNEIGWKPWATDRRLNNDAYRGELIDALHFLMNLMLLAGMTADDVYNGYLDKQRLNRERQAAGYTGTDKCPACKRAYDDAAVKCTPTHTGPDGAGKGWCEVYGAVDTPVLRGHMDFS